MKRHTKQHDIITDAVNSFNDFFTADELFAKVQKRNKKIGIATVYRHLKEMRDTQQIHSFVCDRKTIYSMTDKNHSHFTCEQCGAVQHLKINSIDFIKVKGKICHFQIDVHGKCDKCLNKDGGII